MSDLFRQYLQLVEAEARLHERTIFVDCDGVLANFDSHVQTLFGGHPDSFSANDLWQNINSHDEFFLTVSLMPDAHKLWKKLQPYHPIVLTGCPKSNFERAAKQKIIWIKRHFGPSVPVIPCLSRDKQNYLKHAGDILIDDRSSNIRRWVKAGGVGIQHHNAATTIEKLQQILH